MDPDVKIRYNEKVKLYCDGIDPYGIKDEKDPLPRNVAYFDVCNYCIDKDSSYTLESFKAYKSLEAYQYYVNGWVQSIICKNIMTGSILLAKVKHSQQLNQTPLECWVAVDKNGIIYTGHCNCMAGLGEVCSYVGAVLFVLEAWGRKSLDIDNAESISCTDVLSKWLVPATKKVEMVAVDSIVWDKIPRPNTSQDVSSDTPLASDTAVGSEDVQSQIDNFLHKIMENGVFCPIMAVRSLFSKHFVQKKSDLVLDISSDDDETETNLNLIQLYLPSIFNSAYKSLSLKDLQELAKDIHLSYTHDVIEFIERKTREQSSSSLWYRFRAGRVTGSVFKGVCRTSIISPSISLIEKICFPEQYIFTSKETQYGKDNESVARDAYIQCRRETHQNLEVKPTGLIINNDYPFCGVSPDGIIVCDCCGTGTLEIKCPWLMRFGGTETYLKKRDCPLIVVDDDNGNWHYELKVGHEYYYQIQMQMFLKNSDFCDFVMWNPKSSIIIRVYKDEPFWYTEYAKAHEFFLQVILPELLGNYYSDKKAKKR